MPSKSMNIPGKNIQRSYEILWVWVWVWGIHVSSVTWLSFPGADKLLIRLCKDSKACSGSRPLGISEDAGAVLCHSVSNGFQLGL